MAAGVAPFTTHLTADLPASGRTLPLPCRYSAWRPTRTASVSLAWPVHTPRVGGTSA